MLGWLSQPETGTGNSGVIVLPPTGYPYLCAHRALRVLAERLAERGHTVLRIDYDGTGDSAGDQWDPDRVVAWRASAHHAADELTSLGCRRLMLAGARLGATFALLEGASIGAERIVAWAPVLSGRRYARSLRLLSISVPDENDPCDPPGTIVSAGNVFSSQTLSDMAALNVSELSASPAPLNLIIDDPARSAAPGAEHLRSIGADVEHLSVPGSEEALETPAEFAVVPDAVLEAIVAFLGSADPGGRQPAAGPPVARLRWRGGTVTEELLTLSPHGQRAVCTTPVDPDPTKATLVLLNSGSETHVGPGRAWVEYARGLALLGHRTVRVDFRGWGESPDDGRAPGRPYDPGTEPDTETIVRALQGAGHPRLVLAGLCASAWIVLRVVLRVPVSGVIALNPQMYWQPGWPIEVDPDLGDRLRAKEFGRHERGSRWHVWSLLDMIGRRPPGGRWLDQLAATGVPVTMLFAEGDPGLVFLRTRLSRRMAHVLRTGSITVQEMPEIDHPMHRAWLRPRVLQALHEALDEIDLSR
jgi:pimeloyl-ACP methyl ester carboxylesterase